MLRKRFPTLHLYAVYFSTLSLKFPTITRWHAIQFSIQIMRPSFISIGFFIQLIFSWVHENKRMVDLSLINFSYFSVDSGRNYLCLLFMYDVKGILMTFSILLITMPYLAPPVWMRSKFSLVSSKALHFLTFVLKIFEELLLIILWESN